MPITLAQVAEARTNIAGVALRTPLVRCFADAPAELWLKLENLQPIGSFKSRGAANVMAEHRGTLERGVLTASAGNMAQGVLPRAAHRCACHHRRAVYGARHQNPRRRAPGRA
jgi:threonine dehydratase